MANCGGIRKGTGSPLSKELPAQATSTSQSPPPDGITGVNTYIPNLLSSDNSKAKAYVPSPPLDDIEKVARYMASLNTEQRNTISEFIQATKEPVSVAIHTLQECDWDLIEAVARFGENDAQEEWERETVAPSAPLAEPRGSSEARTPPRRMKQKRFPPEDNLRPWVLDKLARSNGQDWPQNPKNIVYEAITLQYSPSSPNTHTIPMFISPYKDKMWYTGFMKP